MSQSVNNNLNYLTGSEKSTVPKLRILLYVKAGVLGTVIAGVWILFSLPIVFYPQQLQQVIRLYNKITIRLINFIYHSILFTVTMY